MAVVTFPSLSKLTSKEPSCAREATGSATNAIRLMFFFIWCWLRFYAFTSFMIQESEFTTHSTNLVITEMNLWCQERNENVLLIFFKLAALNMISLLHLQHRITFQRHIFSQRACGEN